MREERNRGNKTILCTQCTQPKCEKSMRALAICTPDDRQWLRIWRMRHLYDSHVRLKTFTVHLVLRIEANVRLYQVHVGLRLWPGLSPLPRKLRLDHITIFFFSPSSISRSYEFILKRRKEEKKSLPPFPWISSGNFCIRLGVTRSHKRVLFDSWVSKDLLLLGGGSPTIKVQFTVRAK